jgi:signal transduction histidine kinase
MPNTRFSGVLVVEGSESERQRLCDILEREGFRVVGCGSAADALERIRQHNFSVALFGPRMPDLGGTQLLERMRGYDEHLRVIVFSGAASSDATPVARERGAFACVERPGDSSELIRHVYRACQERANHEARDLQRAVAERMEELARSNHELDDFAFIVAHDLRSPLLTIAGYSQMLLDDYPMALDAAGAEYLTQIVRGVERMDRMIEDLLNYSRVGRSPQTLERVDLQAVVTHSVANLQASIREQGATIESGPLPTVLGNQSQLVQLFQNLIANAIKFRRDVVPVVRVKAQGSSGDWEFTVEDNGIGIAERDMGRLFQVFQRVQCGNYPGTGIGLAICKKIVERHGGRIWLDSAVGQGTKVLFTLPKAESSATRPGHP